MTWSLKRFENSREFMLTCVSSSVNATACERLTRQHVSNPLRDEFVEETRTVADVQIEDGIIKIASLEIQDPKAAAVLAEYPQVRWAEITRRALKIGLGYLKGGGKD